jgi:hypothetical protein
MREATRRLDDDRAGEAAYEREAEEFLVALTHRHHLTLCLDWSIWLRLSYAKDRHEPNHSNPR